MPCFNLSADRAFLSVNKMILLPIFTTFSTALKLKAKAKRPVKDAYIYIKEFRPNHITIDSNCCTTITSKMQPLKTIVKMIAMVLAGLPIKAGSIGLR